jgi:hypothetical protein
MSAVRGTYLSVSIPINSRYIESSSHAIPSSQPTHDISLHNEAGVVCFPWPIVRHLYGEGAQNCRDNLVDFGKSQLCVLVSKLYSR